MTDTFGKKPTKQVIAYAVWCDTGHRIKKVAPCAYAFIIPELFGDQVFWGRGGERDAQVMLAHLIPHLVNVMATSPAHDAGVRLVVRKIGTDLYFESHVWPWLLKESHDEPVDTPRYPVWKKALLHLAIGHVELVAASKNEASKFDAPIEVARKMAKEAERLREHRNEGVTYTDAGVFEDA